MIYEMSNTRRSQVELSITDNSVLIGLLKDMESDEICEGVGKSKRHLSYIISQIKKKFDAKNILHLIALAVLERDYYGILLESTSAQMAHLSDQEIRVAKYALLGLSNNEISKLLDLSRRTVENHRLSFRERSGVDGNAAFVKSCIINGILMITPYNYQFDKSNKYVRQKQCFYPQLFNVQSLRSNFLYIDFQDRFFLDFNGAFLDANVNGRDILILGLILSGIPDQLIFDWEIARKDRVSKAISLWGAKIKEVGAWYFIESLVQQKILVINNKPILPRELGFFASLIMLEHIAKETPLPEIMERTDLTADEVVAEKHRIHQLFNCETEVELLIQARYLSLLKEI